MRHRCHDILLSFYYAPPSPASAAGPFVTTERAVGQDFVHCRGSPRARYVPMLWVGYVGLTVTPQVAKMCTDLRTGRSGLALALFPKLIVRHPVTSAG